jgi:hypothetical protein
VGQAPAAPDSEEGTDVGVDERLAFLEAQAAYLDQQLVASKVIAANAAAALATADKGVETALKVGQAGGRVCTLSTRPSDLPRSCRCG